MSGEPPSNVPATSDLKQRVIDALSEHFAQDRLTLEEFEARVDLAQRATAPESLRVLLRELQLDVAQEAVSARPVSTERERKGRSLMFGFWGGSQRSGSWVPARKNFAVAFQGGVELDFREARFGPGVTEVVVFCAMGGVNIIVPPNLQVDFGGVGIMGGFDAEAGMQKVVDPDAPILRVRGVAVWGGAGVEIRHVGETGPEARQRRRLRKKMKRDLLPPK